MRFRCSCKVYLAFPKHSYNGEGTKRSEQWKNCSLFCAILHCPNAWNRLRSVSFAVVHCQSLMSKCILCQNGIIYIFESYYRLILCLQGKIYNLPSCILFISITKYLLQVQKIKTICGPFQLKKILSSLNYVYIIQAK